MNTQSPTSRGGATASARSLPSPPTSAEFSAPTSAAGGSGGPPPPTLADLLAATRGPLLDLLAAAQEGGRRPHKRVLSRAEIRRQSQQAYDCVTSLLDLAVEGLNKGN